MRFFAPVLLPILNPILRLNSVAEGGDLLANLALGRIAPPTGWLYASQVKRRLTWPEPSELARDDSVMAKLWHDSATLVGLPEENPQTYNGTGTIMGGPNLEKE